MKTDHSSKKKALSAKELLQKTLAERCAKNPQYSIRAFARSSGISHTVLSLVLSDKRKLSKKATGKLADYLGLNPQQKAHLLDTTQGEGNATYRDISLDQFEVISDWYHYAILSLLELPGARFEARWIAQQLGIRILNAKLAMERLQRLNLVEQAEDGEWRPTGESLRVENKVSTAATRKFHQQLLQRAAQSIDSDPIAVRDFSSITFTFDPSQLEYARQRLRDFRRELMAELEVKGQPSSVYQMAIQLYPLTPT